MEGALPSVIGGMASCPVIAVPTSVGYGASFGGSDGLARDAEFVRERGVRGEFDNGFGGGYQAALIDHT